MVAIRITSKDLKFISIFWIGFFIYTIGYLIQIMGRLNILTTQLIQGLGLALILSTGIYLTQFKIKNKYLARLFAIYCIWQLIIIFRGVNFNFDSLKNELTDATYGILLYFAPLIILFPQNFKIYRKLFDFIIIFGVFFILFDIVFIEELLDRSAQTQDVIEYFAKSLGIPCGFILLTYKYHNNKKIVISFCVMILALLFSIYKARRGLSFICLSILVTSYFLYLFSTKRKLLVIYLSILITIIGMFYISTKYQTNKNGLFSFISERGDEDTRTGVEIYFYNDMTAKDWLIGKGMNGEYFCPGIGENQLTDYRNLVETGYLQIILKGGILKLLLYLLITIPALILGLFYSKNILSKASGFWILISLISLYPTTIESFSLPYFLIWISAGICYSEEIRQLSDKKIQNMLNS